MTNVTFSRKFKRISPAFLAFIIPFILMALIYLTLAIFPGSERSVLASDAFSQFSNFHGAYRNMLLGKQGIFYTWNASLGLNFFALSAYYLGGFLTPIVVFFPNQYLPEALYFITLVKIGLAGLSVYFYLRRFRFPKFLTVSLCTTYALSSFAMAHSELVMWLDAFIFLPLIFLGIENLQDGKNPTLLFLSYFGLFVSNFYFGFMIGIFSFLYFIARTLSHFSLYKPSIIRYIWTSFLAVVASLIVTLPTFLDLRENGETLTKITNLKTEATGPFDFLMKNFIGAYDTTKYGSSPFIYIGLIPLVFCVFFFFTKKVSRKEKFAYLSLIVLLEASFYFVPLNLFWHGMHAPNMFLFRYSFLLSFLIFILALRGLWLFEKRDYFVLMRIFLFFFVAFLAGKIFLFKKYEYITIWHLLITLLFIGIYIVLFTFPLLNPQKMRLSFVFLASFLILEAFINGSFVLHGILKDWNYASKSLFTEPYPAISSLVDKTKKDEKNFYRLENLDPVSSNDSFNYGYSGISMFSSIRNRHSSSLLNQLGYKSRGTNLNIRYQNNTLLADALFGVRYNLNTTPLDKFGYDYVKADDQYQLFKNQYANELGILTDKKIYDVELPKRDNLTAQTALYNALSQSDERFFTYLEPEVTNLNNTKVVSKGNQVTYQEVKKNIGKDVSYKVTVPKNKQAYLSLYLMDYGEAKSSSATLIINGKETKSQLDITGQYLDLGYYPKETTIEFKVNFYGSEKVTFMRPKVMLFDIPSFKEAHSQLKPFQQKIKTTNNGAHFTYKIDKEKVLFTTIPYDKGWKAKIDGKKVPIKPFKDALITLKLPKGSHKVTLTFVPKGFYAGLAAFIFSFAIFFSYVFLLSKNHLIVKTKKRV